MSKTLADMDVARAGDILSQCGPAAMYDYMADFGDKYAVLANGVARGGSLSGNAALRHMQAMAEKSGKTLSGQDVDKIRLDMAEAYLRVRSNKSEIEDYTQLTAREAQTFHRRVFRDNNLPEKAWTLEVPFNMWGEKASETLWQDILDSTGSRLGEIAVSAEISGKMAAIEAGLRSKKVTHDLLGVVYDTPDEYNRDVESLRDVSEWLNTNISVGNFKEAVLGPESPESAQEALECIVEPQAIDMEAPAPAPLQEPAPLGEPLQKRSYPTSLSETSPPPTTMHRLIQAHTPLGDALWAVSLTGREALSSLYRFTVRFKSNSPDVDCQAMIGDPHRLRFREPVFRFNDRTRRPAWPQV